LSGCGAKDTGVRSAILDQPSATINRQFKVRIRIIREGKPNDANLRALQTDYQERISHFVDVRIEENPALDRRTEGRRSGRSAGSHRWLEGLQQGYKILLDPSGREWSSEQFAEWLGERAVRGTRELIFLVGGDKGSAPAVREQADLLLGLSRMTFTHDWACTLLLEQIYRAFTILRGFPYAK
jgi:23S rRNA (pseudouridine1915-N3)-methyltransferase